MGAPDDDCDRYIFFLYIICYYIFLSLNATAFTKITTNNTIYSLWFIDCLHCSCSRSIPRYCLLSNTYTNIDCFGLIMCEQIWWESQQPICRTDVIASHFERSLKADNGGTWLSIHPRTLSMFDKIIQIQITRNAVTTRDKRFMYRGTS